MKFVVKRYEVWEQEVEVEAEDEDEAIHKVWHYEGSCTIVQDPKFKDMLPRILWRAEKA